MTTIVEASDMMPNEPNILVYTLLLMSGSMIQGYYTLDCAYGFTCDVEPSHWMIPLRHCFEELSNQDL